MSIYGERDPVADEYSALLKQIEAGHYTSPEEIWDVIRLLIEADDPKYRTLG